MEVTREMKKTEKDVSLDTNREISQGDGQGAAGEKKGRREISQTMLPEKLYQLWDMFLFLLELGLCFLSHLSFDSF